MAERNWVRHGLSIGLFEFRRSVRAIWQDKARFALMALGILIPSLMGTAVVIIFAETIRDIESLLVPNQIRGMVALFWLFAVFMISQRVISAHTHIEAEPFMLTTVSRRTVAGGLLVAETLRFLSSLGLPALVVTGIGVFLLGSPASLILVPMAVLLFTTTAVVTGAAIGYAVAWLVATSRFVARHKTVLGSIASLIAMGVYFLFLYPQIGGVTQASLAWLPMGWVTDLAVVGTPFIWSPFRLIGALLWSVVCLFIGAVIVERETSALWITDPVSIDIEETPPTADVAEEENPSRTSRRDALATAVKPLIIPRVFPTPIRRVAEWALLRTRRDPNRLMFLLLPIFAFGPSFISTGVQSGSVDAFLPPICAIVLPWLAGALFAMNPLGDEGTVLPVTLTAVSGAHYVRGLMVPGVVFGLPICIVVIGITGILSPYTVVEQVGLLLLGIYLTCIAVTIAPAIGMALPRFSAISVGQSREVLPPRMSAAGLHMALTVLPGAWLVALLIVPQMARTVLAGVFGSLPAFILGLLADSNSGVLATASTWFSDFSGGILSVDLGQLQVIGGGVVLLGGVVVSLSLYWNAIHRFERYSPS